MEGADTGLAFPPVRAYYQEVRSRVFVRAVNLPADKGCEAAIRCPERLNKETDQNQNTDDKKVMVWFGLWCASTPKEPDKSLRGRF
jgi:hypothetical protein